MRGETTSRSGRISHSDLLVIYNTLTSLGIRSLSLTWPCSIIVYVAASVLGDPILAARVTSVVYVITLELVITRRAKIKVARPSKALLASRDQRALKQSTLSTVTISPISY
jgi:hypothetical protein